MLERYSRRKSFKILVLLIIVVIVLASFSIIGASEYDSNNIKDVADVPIGSTVLPGTHVIDDGKIMKYPLATNFNYLFYKIKGLKLLDAFISITTGTVSVPVYKISETGISDDGDAQGFEGPGVLVFENQKLSVKSPDNFVWGHTTPYTLLVKSKDGINLVENNKTISTIASNNINNNTIPHDYVSIEEIEEWYNKTTIGDSMVVKYALSNFSDGRNLIKPDEIKKIFGEDIYNYTTVHNLNSPILVYMHNYTEEEYTEGYSYLGSYPQYNDANRAFNAQQFAKAWNGTIIPPNSSSSGQSVVGFASSIDPKAPGGAASHGVCPAARALRSAVLSADFPLPSGMNGDFNAVNFGVNPGSGIYVTNSEKYPVKIVMWTEGSGTGTVIYAKLIKFVPN
ncbi:hypothetical protein MBCUT_01870 [Methanobrevibacter cuticularis]|uniref:Uncharacterized protein n=1 Tax=Methanobrevibacter cuticularis TaxID=47311 RepID=A0A166FBV0_9EURY|nr:hypothetical protein [Methanobrevibacter cuticularis]KZX17512.1 hypothetical protein MBCUT_01870 [Methanobrevibacter cuticularis]